MSAFINFLILIFICLFAQCIIFKVSHVNHFYKEPNNEYSRYSVFRDQLSEVVEERVEVNQRDLIDKVLTRYASEFVIYRELMQNSDDAESSSIQIRFESRDNNKQVTRIIFKNNGFAFRNEDWMRLKKIAEGNPDVQKIGAFGVGFYSLFSVCENPFVTSGGRGMDFFWRGKQLYTRHGPIDDTDNNLTTFLMDMREPTEFPHVEKFARFLANSLGFTGNLQEISVYFNDILEIQLSKTTKGSRLMNIPSVFDRSSSQKMFELTSVEVRDVQLDIKKLTVPTNLSARLYRQPEKTSISLRIANGNLNLHVSDEFSAAMVRLTKKKPPSKTNIQMIFTGFDEYNLSGNCISPIFKDLLPYPEQGKIYIGFSTNQTTGCCSHLAARVIPTVMRDSVDLADKTLGVYNGEMLSIAGTLCRILYEDEMARIARFYNENYANIKSDENMRERLEKWAAYALNHFMFRTSTPNEKVGQITESQFFKSSGQNVYILSTNGVLPISDVRIPNIRMNFIKNVPIVPNIIWEQCKTFFTKAKDMKLIGELTFKDVLNELRSRILSEDEMVKLLKWWIFYRTKGNDVNPYENSQFMQHSRGDKFRALNTIRYILNPAIIPLDVDVPAEVLPYTISQHLRKQDLEKWFGWTELSLVDWAKFIVKKPDLNSNPTFAEKVHQILAKSLNNNSQKDNETIRQLFIRKKCVPTNFGMEYPGEAYFQNVNLFPDLPMIQFQNLSSVQNVMEFLGVRKTVELKLIFDRLVSQGDWNHMELIKYLASISDNLEEKEITILKNKPIWPKENSQSMPIIQRFIANDLYVPSALNRDFGLPVIDWKEKWSNKTIEGIFLIELGLREYPTLEKIMELSAPPTDLKIRNEALKYFIRNFEEKYSQNYNQTKVDVAFLPCSFSNNYAKPSECFINPECKIMKFQVVRQDLRFQVRKFGVRPHPSSEKLLERLKEDIPQDENKAKRIFEYLASQQGNFDHHDWVTLANLEFIPIRNYDDTITYTNPCSCFFEIPEKILNDFFTRVDFGEKANKFLQSCGVQNEPSPVAFAELLVTSSRKLWNLMGDNVEKYLTILRRISIDYDIIASKHSELIDRMMIEPILIAIEKGNDNKKVNHLASAKDIFINDDPTYQQIFNPLIAPEDDLIETLYRKLRCKSLHESVNETVTPNGVLKVCESSANLQETIRERASLFYYDHPKGNIKRDEEWLKTLEVREIDSIKTVYVLKDITVVKEDFTTACILHNEQLKSWVLYITPIPDNIDISQHLCNNIYKSAKWMEISYFNMILTTDLSSLKRKGYPVDRILQSKAENVFKKYEQESSVKKPVNVTTETTRSLQNSLQDAIRACHSNFGSTIDSQPNVTIVEETKSSYCDIIPGHLLFCVGTKNDIELYDTNVSGQPSEILSLSNDASLDRFIKMLKDLAIVFELTPQAIHVFYDNNSNTIAFNRDRALFFNLKFYIGLHDEECKIKPTCNAMTYWFMTFCHELAHNLVRSHNSDHEYYFSSFAETYMSKFLTVMRLLQIVY